MAAHARQFVRSADVRYQGQSFELTVTLHQGGRPGLQELPELFRARHDAVYGFADGAGAVEVINLRVQAVGAVARPDRLAPRADGATDRADRPTCRRAIMLDGRELTASVHRRT